MDLETSNPVVAVTAQQIQALNAVLERAPDNLRYRQMLADARRMRAEAQGKREAVRGAQLEIAAARAERQSAAAELAAMQTDIADAEAMFSAASADQEYWTSEQIAMRIAR